MFFDAGNTLLAADPPVEIAYGAAFARYGVNAPAQDVAAAVRATWNEVAARQSGGRERWGERDGERGFWRGFVQAVFARVGGGALPESLLSELVEHFGNQDHWAVYPDVRDVLAALRREGYRLLVVSNWDSTLPRLLERLRLTPLFDDVVVSALVGASKPAREIFDLALESAAVAPHEAIHVGDSPAEDYEGARRAGLSPILLDRAGIAPGGFRTIRSLDELVPLLHRAA